ncbi:hypothetical protein [Plesiomonas shigelloides]|uniref:hypothetical protein n=1 Tax=Plesiomonas shigelloides TaxID=703 RepID=UPI003EBCCEF5
MPFLLRVLLLAKSYLFMQTVIFCVFILLLALAWRYFAVLVVFVSKVGVFSGQAVSPSIEFAQFAKNSLFNMIDSAFGSHV